MSDLCSETLECESVRQQTGFNVAETPRLRAPLQLLRGAPREIIQRLTRDDPLALNSRVRDYLHRRRFLMDEYRVVLGALALIARNARSYRGRPGIERWLDGQIESAVNSLRVTSAHSQTPCGSRWKKIAVQFALETDALDAACVLFHRLPFEARDAFFRLVLERRTIESVVYPGGRGAGEIARDARRGLAIFLKLKPQRIHAGGPS